MNAFTTTFSGQQIPADPDRLGDAVFFVADIAHALARQPRFNGHTDERYSVAEHSVNVSLLLAAQGLDPLTQYAGLMHDAHEAYVGDVAAPQKAFIPGFDEYERKFAHAVQRAHGLDPRDRDMWEAVRLADLQALALENRYFRRGTPNDIIPEVPGQPSEVPFKTGSTKEARIDFLAHYDELRATLQWI